MSRISFASDYIKGCHPRILERLSEINADSFSGYGSDEICASAAEKIRLACGCPEASVRFISGGTQTNQLVIDTMLDATEGVISAETGHVSVHEAGAVEFSGHKVLTLPSHDGMIDPKELKAYLETFYADDNHEHMVYPGMVYITFPTEFGTVYSRESLEEIAAVCRAYDIRLYIDGARMGYGLAASGLSLKDIASAADAFYIGGTKIGALFGEALVFTRGCEPSRFVTRMKQHGALLAKGWIAGLQFDTLFTDDLYLKISANAVEKAARLREIMVKAGFPIYMDSPTNQQFFVVPDACLKELEPVLGYSFWEKYDEMHTVIRLAASFATTDADLDELESVIKSVHCPIDK